MAKDLENLLRLKDKKYRIKKIEVNVKVAKTKKTTETATVTLERNGNIQAISSSEECFCSYVSHLHSISHIEDDESDFIYIDNPNEFFDIQKKIVDMFSGEQKDFIVCERRIQKEYQRFSKIIENYEKNWILSEKQLRIFPTKLCRIFHDIGVLMIKDSNEKFDLIDKAKFNLSDLQELLRRSQKYDIAVCFSAFILAPVHNHRKNEGYDAIVGLITYDLKNNKTLSFNLNTLVQFQRKIQDVGQYGLWQCISDLFEKIKGNDSFKSFLPLPLNVRNFTPLPWFCYVFLNGIQEDIAVDGFVFDLPLFIVFGTPLILHKKPSYMFRPEKQMAFIMLGFQEGNEASYHHVRFDVSKGGPTLHLDYVIYSGKGASKKVISHHTINYEDIWNFSENLAIGFLVASAYDVNFETIIIPKRLSGIEKAFKMNPLTVYPLFVRSMAASVYRWLKGKPEAIDTLRNIAAKKEVIDGKQLVSELEKKGLVKQGELTVLGDILCARLQQRACR